jgi:hypothetical protein
MTLTTSPELVDAEIALEGHRSINEEHNLLRALTALPDVHEPILYGGLLVLQCSPSKESKESIREAVEDAGLSVSWMKMRPVRTDELDELAPD